MVAGTGRMLDYFIGIDITERKPNIPKAKKAPKGSRAPGIFNYTFKSVILKV